MTEKNIPPCMIYINKDGKWFYQGVEMVHKGIISDFYKDLKADSHGEYFIIRGQEKCFVEVEDTPFIITRVEFDTRTGTQDERITLLLIDDTKEYLDPDTLRLGTENITYCRIKGNTFNARFSRAAYYQLASRIKEKGDKYYLPFNNKKYYIQM